MTTTATPGSWERTIVVDVPALAEERFIGSGCCVVAADHVLQRELESWPGVTDVVIEPDKARLTVTVRRDDLSDSDLVETIRSVGLIADLHPTESQERR